MNFTVKHVTKNIVKLVFPDSNIMCRTMVRFGEHFESPEFRNRIFTWRQFKSWYRWEKGGKFTYYDDWGGYNLPASAFDAFKAGKFDPLTWGERDVLNAIKDLPKNFYVIAVPVDEEGEMLRHELGHAFYASSEAYRKCADAILATLPDTHIPKEAIRMMGYCEEVLQDELHAYLIDGMVYFSEIANIRQRLGWRAYFKYLKASRALNKLLDRALEAFNAAC